VARQPAVALDFAALLAEMRQALRRCQR
jgi:hypothetical protein